jgi:hypothetical protein
MVCFFQEDMMPCALPVAYKFSATPRFFNPHPHTVSLVPPKRIRCGLYVLALGVSKIGIDPVDVSFFSFPVSSENLSHEV